MVLLLTVDLLNTKILGFVHFHPISVSGGSWWIIGSRRDSGIFLEVSPKDINIDIEQEQNLGGGFLNPMGEDTFLKNIVEYGNARMARRAVGVLQKMRYAE